jgi:uncharacterized protein YjbJ (UPF0337 family)
MSPSATAPVPRLKQPDPLLHVNAPRLEQNGQRAVHAFDQRRPRWTGTESGNWKQVKGAVKQQWGKLTDDDLTHVDGSLEKLEGVIRERYGIARDETRKQIDSWYQNQDLQ